MALCRANHGAAVVVRKQMAILISAIRSPTRLWRLALFLVNNDEVVGSGDFLLPHSSSSDASLFASFDVDFFACDAGNATVLGYIYRQFDEKPWATFSIDLATFLGDLQKRMSDDVFDVALEDARIENNQELGRLQLQFAWWFTPGAVKPAAPPRRRRRDSAAPPITFIYVVDGVVRRSIANQTPQCPLCGITFASAAAIVVHVALCHDGVDVRFRGSRIFLSPTPPTSIEVDPLATDVIVCGAHFASFLTQRILSERELTARQVDFADSSRKRCRPRTSIKSEIVPPSKKRGRLAKWKGSPQSRFNAKTFYSGSSFAPIRTNEVVDSDLEIDETWLERQCDQTIAMFEDVADDDKALMLLWNEARRRHEPILGDKQVVAFCEHFAGEVRDHSRPLRQAFLNHLLVLWEFGLLNSTQLKTIMAVHDHPA